MLEDPIMTDKSPEQGWRQHSFLLMVGVAVLISLFLVGVALALYASSGAAQLDLSRPGYQSVRNQAGQNGTFDGFSTSGELDPASLEQFRKLYEERAQQATSVDSFGGNVLSDDSLSIDPPGAGE